MGVPKILRARMVGQPMRRQDLCRQRESGASRGAIAARPATHLGRRTTEPEPAVRDDSLVDDHGVARSGFWSRTRHGQGRVLAMPTKTDAGTRIGMERLASLQRLGCPQNELAKHGIGAGRLVGETSDARRAFAPQTGMTGGGARGEVR